MLEWIIRWSLERRILVALAALGFAIFGIITMDRLRMDAFPDTTPVQVQVNAVANALSPEEVESRITFPIEQAISGIPRLEAVRSLSKYGLAQVTAIFEDGTDTYFARQLVAERLAAVDLPEGLPRPEMGPASTGLGEVFHYLVIPDAGTAGGTAGSAAGSAEGSAEAPAAADPSAPRTVQDWSVKPRLSQVRGTAEVNSWGGFKKEYQVLLDPLRLQRYGLTFSEALEAVAAGNAGVGGGHILRSGDMVLVQGMGRTASLEEIGAIVIAARDGVPVRVRDVAECAVGHEIRRGAVTADGKGEAVLGLGFMLPGENSREYTRRLEARLQEVRRDLPQGVRVETVYERTRLVDQVIDTVRRNLFEGGLLVVAVLFTLLGSLRAGLIVALAIPLSMLFAFAGMYRFGIAGSLLSLGAIDFGMIVDSSLILVENILRRLGAPEAAGRDRMEVIRDAALEVRRPTLFGELIILIVYLPILTLEGVEGKLFRPMAITVILALVGSLILSLTLMPALAAILLRGKAGVGDPLPARMARRLYAPVLRLALAHRFAVTGLAVLLVAAAALAARGLGSEFLPRLSEGTLVINIVRLAGTDLDESVRYDTLMEKAILAAFPDEVEHVWSRIGSAEVATDPMGVELSDIFFTLKPREAWKRARTQAELVDLMRRELRDLPGQRLAFTQPIEMRLNEMTAGTRGDVAVKIFGDDFQILQAKAREVEEVLHSIPGATDISTEQVSGQQVLQVRLDQEALARHGISARKVLDIVEAIGAKALGEVLEGQVRFPLAARLPERYRSSPEAVGTIPVLSPTGEAVPLSRLASITLTESPSTINREWGRRRITVQANVPGGNVGGYVDEARRRVAQEVKLPPGRYHIEWGGQFEHMERARGRLSWVVPLALASILVLLRMSLGSMGLSALVFTGVPLAMVGGVAALWIRAMPFSIPAAVGFIALSGVAVLNGLVMVTFIRDLRSRGVALEEAVVAGSLARLRPVLMTALVAALGFLPMALSTGVGAEVQRPLATVVVGGVVSSTLLTLMVIPVLYGWFETWRMGRTAGV